MTTCPDDFDVTSLYAAANLSSDVVRVGSGPLQAVIGCYTEQFPVLGREFVHNLRITGKGNSVKVDRLALFELMKMHAQTHEKTTVQRVVTPTGRIDPLGPETQKISSKKEKKEADALAMALKEHFAIGNPSLAFKELCVDNAIDPKKFEGRGFGLARMALGNELRAKMGRNELVKVGDKKLINFRVVN